MRTGVTEDDLDEMSLWQRVRTTCLERDVLHLAAKDSPKARLNDGVIAAIAQFFFKYDGAQTVLVIEPGYVVDATLTNFLHDGHVVQGKGIKSFSTNPGPVSEHDLEKTDRHQYFCKIQVRDELVFAHRLIPRNQLRKTGRPRIGFLIPSKNAHSNPPDTALFSNLFQSLSRTITKLEMDNFEMVFYLGFDSGDPLLDSLEFESDAVRLVRLPRTRWLTFIWNRLYDEAHRDGCDLFIQINDDITFLAARGWLTTIARLILVEEYMVVGLNDYLWQCQLYTQAAISRKHHSLFKGHMYPLTFCNWYSDTWLTYIHRRSTCAPKALVRNGSPSQARYQHCSMTDEEFSSVLQESKQALEKV